MKQGRFASPWQGCDHGENDDWAGSTTLPGTGFVVPPIPRDVIRAAIGASLGEHDVTRDPLKRADAGSGTASRQWLCLLGAATMLTPPGASVVMAQTAQAAQTATPAAESGAPALGEIVVTATRKQESIQKVPVSLQALTMDKLEQHEVKNFTDYAQMLPSVSFDTLGPGRSNFYFRGISVGGVGLPTAALYLDDVPMTSSNGQPEIHIYDVERVEALSGPQGTLFGSSSLAGTMRIITQKPKLDKWEAGMDVQAAKYGAGDTGGQVEGYLNAPLAANLALRVMAFYDHEGGYIDNTPASYTYTFGQNNPAISYVSSNAAIAKNNYNPVTEWGGRASLLAEAGNWSIMPSITYQHLASSGTFNYDPRFSGLQVHDYTPTHTKDEWYQASLTIQGQIAGLDVTGVVGYFHRATHILQDYAYYSIDYDKMGGSYYYFRDQNGAILDPAQYATESTVGKKITEELRIATPKSSKLQMTAGVFHQYQKNSFDADYIYSGSANGYAGTDYDPTTGIFTPTNPAPAVRGNALYATDYDQTYKDFGLYAEATYPILPAVKVTGGIRYFSTSNNTYGFNGTIYDMDTCSFPLTKRLQCINVNEPYHQTGETHKASIAWQVRPDKMLYFTYSTGFRPGGGNNLTGSSPYKADTLDNFEIGVKARFGRNLRVNAAAYYEKWNGVQYQVVVPNTFGSTNTVNAGDARVYGIEADFDWKIGPVLISGSGAYNDSRLSTNFCDLVSSSNLVPRSTCSSETGDLAASKGTRLPRQPRFKGQLTVRYERPIGRWNAFVQGVAFHQSSSTSDLNTANDALFGDPTGFESFDFSTGAKRGGFSAEIFIQNTFDKRGVLSRNAFCEIQTCTEGSRSYPIKPQYFGIRFSQKFL
ncbi:TonB-dependent receptor [Novosphingobium nitrogenifigens DSM 19370]|uniref:TonB-dependent receptor n=1 Tax=Novosphingobium nitrogenifigens DSM 19370 TaxID=983920 RepID=F1Z3G6_9SPHN|nr:TonB-dependent receptor [Novosphingobium nitrogenifigens DSM 19370]